MSKWVWVEMAPADFSKAWGQGDGFVFKVSISHVHSGRPQALLHVTY